MADTIGKDGLAYINGTDGAVQFFDSWSVLPKINIDREDAFGDASNGPVLSLERWTAITTGMVGKQHIDGKLVPLSKLESVSKSVDVELRLYDSTSHWFGNAFVTSKTINSQDGDKVSVSWTFQGNGDLEYATT